MKRVIFINGLPKINTVNSFATKTRKFAVPYGNKMVFVAEPLKVGNSKLGDNIAIFNLLAVHSCMNCKDCAKSCYALKSQKQYPSVFDKRAIYTYLARNHVNILFELLDNNLNRLLGKIKYVRIHESGDFLSQEYIDLWERLIKKYPSIVFYTYTKVDKIFDFSGLKSLPNFNLVNSVLPDGSINFGNEEYCTEKATKFNYIICPNRKGHKVHCGTECTACMRNHNVVFLQH